MYWIALDLAYRLNLDAYERIEFQVNPRTKELIAYLDSGGNGKLVELTGDRARALLDIVDQVNMKGATS